MIPDLSSACRRELITAKRGIQTLAYLEIVDSQ